MGGDLRSVHIIVVLYDGIIPPSETTIHYIIIV